MYCKKCGMKLLDGDPFCSSCGEPTGSSDFEKMSLETKEKKTEEKRGIRDLFKLIGESLGFALIVTFLFNLRIYIGIIIFIVVLAAELIYEVLKEQ